MYKQSGLIPIAVKRNTKQPSFAGWQKTSIDTAVQGVAAHDGNLGVTFGDDIFVLDLDVKHSKNGIEALRALEALHGDLPATLTQHTAGGGLHLFFRKPADVAFKNSVNSLGDGIDVRAKGGFVVVEPSTIDGKAYSFDDWSALDGEIPEIANAPQWLLKLLASPEKSATTATPSGDGAKLSEGGRNDALFRDASAMRRRGFDEETIFAALTVRNRKDCTPPLDDSEIRTIANSASRYAPAIDEHQSAEESVETDDSDTLAALEGKLIPIRSIGAADDEPLPEIVAHWLPCREVTMAAGHGAIGKSTVSAVIGVHVAVGRNIGPLAVRKSKVLIFSAEDSAIVQRQRIRRICKAMGIDHAELDGQLFVLDASDFNPALHHEQRINANGRQSIVTETKLLFALAELVEKLDVKLIIIDNASDVYDDDEIKRARVRAFLRSLRQRIAKPDRAVLLLAHINKSSARSRDSEDYSGSTAWHNSVRSRLSLVSGGVDRVIVEHVKANYNTLADPLVFEWHSGVPLPDGCCSIDRQQAERLRLEADAMRDEIDKSTLVSIIQDFDRRGETVTTATTGSAPVFKLLKSCSQFPNKTDSERLTRLLRSLESEARIFRRTIRTPDRKYKNVFSCQSEPESAPNTTDDAKNDGEKVAA